MARTGWEHHDLEVEMRDCNLADLISVYKREEKKYGELCHQYVNNMSKFSDEGKASFNKVCELQDEARTKVALVIAETLTKETKK